MQLTTAKAMQNKPRNVLPCMLSRLSDEDS